jgi:hypothetical protein
MLRDRRTSNQASDLLGSVPLRTVERLELVGAEKEEEEHLGSAAGARHA